MIDRVLPNSLETEQALLSALLINNKGFKDIGSLKPSDFYNTANNIIYRSMLELLSIGKNVDYVTLVESLNRAGKLESVGDLKYVTHIYESAPIAFGIKSYARTVIDLSITRHAITMCMQIIDNGYKSNDVQSFIQDAQQKIMNIETSSSKDIFYSMSDLMIETIERIEKVQKLDQEINLDLGMPSLENAMFVAGSKLIILAGRPGMGKTALMLSIAKCLGHQEVKSGILSIEMDREEISDRFLSVESDINALKFYVKNQFDEKGIDSLSSFADDLSQLPILVDDSNCDIEDVKRKCRKFKAKGCRIIFIDQLSKISYPAKMNEFQGYSKNCSEIAVLKKELKIPIVLLCQVGRKVEERGNKRPMLSDLKQTGQIEDDADMVFFLYRDGYYDEKVESSRTEIRLAKNRNGGLGLEQNVLFNAKRAMFTMGV